ncbi:serine-threonine protein phosphatase, putative [Bodo saltans]|uniref:Serine/threonine-protein phosphatase n=1 Tax=Bodo saltans TaxID=75058 RepID=A0A0S4JDD1_BODSA|nr:serine-threonine protein phosphatase, putative [Bodo saltans]|eukprot:CUG88056.1 serine-threonine protein phosphatase, putative [Bodo saltans]
MPHVDPTSSHEVLQRSSGELNTSNEGLELDTSVASTQPERGLPQVRAPPSEPLDRSAVFDEDGRPRPHILCKHFRDGGVLRPEDVIEIIQSAASILRHEPNVLVLEDPITICGDVHGQYFDLMTLFELGGDPSVTQYLFLGDYVDRGCFSTEVTLYLLSLKIARPTAIWLLRGNHECRHLTSYFNFREECLHKYNEEVYDTFMACFDALPLAALLNSTFLCVHGGLSPDIKSVDDISLIDRFREPPTSGAMCDLLWADPMEDEEEQMCPDALYLHNELRGCSYVFSFAAVRQFLVDNKLAGIVRAHEAQDEGFRMFRKVEETGFPSVICVFSAPNYCDTYDNKASILEVNNKLLQIRQFHSVEHPYVLPNFMNAFTWSLPFVFDKVGDIVSLLSGCSANRPASWEDSVFIRRGGVMRAKVKAVIRFLWLRRRVGQKLSVSDRPTPTQNKR